MASMGTYDAFPATLLLYFHFISHSEKVTTKVAELRFLTCPKKSNILHDMTQLYLRHGGTEAQESLPDHSHFVCGEPPCMKQKQKSALRLLRYCTSICIQRGTLSLSPLDIHPANEVFMLEAFAF